ncbi:uncharacterized protein LOC135231277 [Loxodonta africana]|uniref:uncharacterized protein LOC135231277 n=1 Tax=Loxodonta africana TaxID=9785 RepID=UPI0030CBB373
MAAWPAPDKEEQPPLRRRRRPPLRPGPKRRKHNLPITESLLFPRIHYHQCPACECVSGRGESGRERRAGGRAAVPAPRPGAPSASLSTSPLLAPALPGHLPPPTPHSLLAGATAPTTRRQRRTGGRGARRRVWLSAAESECLPRLLLLLLRRLLPSSPRRRRCLVLRLSSSRRRHRRWCRRYRSTNYIRATRMLPPSENIGSFRRARPLPPSVFLPAQRSSRTAPSANLGLCRPSSSSEACFASSRPVSSFRLPLLFLTRASGHPYSCSGLAPLRDLLEAGPSGSGVRRGRLREEDGGARRKPSRTKGRRLRVRPEARGWWVPSGELSGRPPPPLRALIAGSSTSP